MPLTALPTPPSRNDSANFAARGDALLAALPLFVAEVNALQITTNAQTAADKTASAVSSAQAVSAKDQAVAAWAASMSPAETLPAISQSIHSGTIVKAIIYDTSKDTDGGAWRKRCTDKSWYTETLGGAAWLGQAGNAAAAWALSGAVTGSYFQNVADGKFYALGASSPTVAEVFRGNAREFPEQVAIVADSVRVVIYDLTQIGCPMWWAYAGHVSTLTGVGAANGKVLVSCAGATNVYYGLGIHDFVADSKLQYSASSGLQRQTGVRAAYSNTGYVTGVNIVNSTVNDVALTVLDGAPIDPATGLPVPTIWVASSGGLSVIQQTGVVVNETTRTQVSKIAVISQNRILAGAITTNWRYTYYTLTNGGIVVGAEDGAFVSTILPSINRGNTTGSVAASAKQTSFAAYGPSGGPTGVGLRIENPTSPLKSMGALITNAYNSGWQVGDIRGAYLADTVAETITASGELVVNGTFATDTSGWTADNGAALSVVAGVMRLTSNASEGLAYQNIATVVGRTYEVGYTYTAGTAAGQDVRAMTSDGVTTLGIATSTAGANRLSFAATATLTRIRVRNTSAGTTYADIDNISVKLADPDRSVKNNGLVFNGTLTKTAVATGADLVAYSGFSATSYLEQPYNAALDFGTGDFCVMGWANVTNLGIQQLFDRGSAGAGRIGLSHDTQWGLTCSATAAATASGVNVTLGLHFVCLYRTAGVIKLNVDTVEVYSAANTANVSNAMAPLTVGASYLRTAPLISDSIALWRISTTAPSADQLAHIYRTELPLFQAGAQCTIAGSSTAVTALAHDDTSELLHVGTSWGRSGFKNLLRVDSEATITGALTSLSANQGAVLTCGTSGRYYQPALLLRDELRRKDAASAALGKVPVFFEFDTASFTSPTTAGSAALTASGIVGTPYIGMSVTGVGIPAGATLSGISGTAYTLSVNATVTNAGAVAIAQSSYKLQQGYTTKAVYSGGVLKRLGATKDYTSATDGFAETVNFGTTPGSAVWVSIMAVRA